MCAGGIQLKIENGKCLSTELYTNIQFLIFTENAFFNPILIPAIMQKMEISSEKVLTSTEILSLLEYHKHIEKNAIMHIIII